MRPYKNPPNAEDVTIRQLATIHDLRAEVTVLLAEDAGMPPRAHAKLEQLLAFIDVVMIPDVEGLCIALERDRAAESGQGDRP